MDYQHLKTNWHSKLADDFPEATFANIINYGSSFWNSLDLTIDNDTNIPRTVIYHAIQDFNNLEQSEEEINLILIELNRLFTFWNIQKLEAEKKLQQLKIDNNLFKVNIYLFIVHILNYNIYIYEYIYDISFI